MQASVGGIGTFVSIVVVITLIGRGTPWAVLAAVALVSWGTYFYRLLHMAVIVRGDTLLARNLAATHRVERSSVTDVTLAESRVTKGPNQTVLLRLAGGRVLALDACARVTDSRRRRRRVDDYYRYLTEWWLGPPPDVSGPEPGGQPAGIHRQLGGPGGLPAGPDGQPAEFEWQLAGPEEGPRLGASGTSQQ